MQFNSQPFLIEGKLTNLHWELGSENLLAKVSKHYKGSAIVTGTGAVVGDMFGQVANAAMLAMYDGEDTQNFMCLIDDQPACGQFGGAEHLPEGGHIKAVVSRRDGVLYVHAAMDEKRELVWINHPWGTRAEMWANLKIALFVFLSVNIGFAIFWLIGGKNSFWENTQFSLLVGGDKLDHGPLVNERHEGNCRAEYGVLSHVWFGRSRGGQSERLFLPRRDWGRASRQRREAT